jgi:hypothetical protein
MRSSASLHKKEYAPVAASALFSPPQLEKGRSPSGAAAILALSAYLLFAHGCHGDEDHELFEHLAVGRVSQPGSVAGSGKPDLHVGKPHPLGETP